MFRNKRGWIKIMEAFLAILLLAGVALIVLNKTENQKQDTVSTPIENFEISILREIELNSTLRSEILDSSGEIESEDFSSIVPLTNAKIQNGVPSFFECRAKICPTSSSCILIENQEKSIYAESILITADSDEFNPKILKIFCWGK